MTETYNKLVRNKVPEIIRNNGQYPVTHIATEMEYKAALDRKLIEEVAEYLSSGKPEELADVIEVICAICENRGFSKKELDEIVTKKAAERGKFLERIILEKVE